MLVASPYCRGWFWERMLCGSWLFGRARHPGPRCPPSNKLCIECVYVGAWFINGDLGKAKLGSWRLLSAGLFLPPVVMRVLEWSACMRPTLPSLLFAPQSFRRALRVILQ